LRAQGLQSTAGFAKPEENMKLTGEYEFDAPLEDVWKALLDPVVLAATMPGCEKLELVGGAYVGELNVKVGPVQGKFSGKVDLEDVVEHESFTMKIDGRGAPGFVKATVPIKLERIASRTKMTYDADASVGGKLASVGQRLVEASAKAIAKQSLEALNETIKARVEDEIFRETSQVDGTSEEELPVISRLPPPPPVPRSLDQNQLAVAVAKEVGKSLAPRIAMWAIAAIVIAGLLWLLIINLK
jgi:carbon monoxide dehydrogenase subunit G